MLLKTALESDKLFEKGGEKKESERHIISCWSLHNYTRLLQICIKFFPPMFVFVHHHFESFFKHKLKTKNCLLFDLKLKNEKHVYLKYV